MLRKKTAARRDNSGADAPIDFSWLTYIGMNRLGFTYRECGRLYFGQWCDLFEAYKRQHNFEQKGMLYETQEPGEPISSLDVL
ncbi:MAG: hypothetical protein NC331_11310 [Lachnospiraceae bacterium]|nr:hypothetical protein [Lachnospiraceae bacterium]MCM1239955.1 hypothetical protein [Lachnospiraceae bacterium]